MLRQFFSLILSFFIVAFGVYFSFLEEKYLKDASIELIVWVGFIILLLIINLNPEPHPDTIESAKTLPLWERMKIYWAVIWAGITDLILIIFEFLGMGN